MKIWIPAFSLLFILSCSAEESNSNLIGDAVNYIYNAFKGKKSKYQKSLQLDEGLKIQTLEITRSNYPVKSNFKLFTIHLDPQNYQIHLSLAKDFHHEVLKAKEYSRLSRSFLSINGGFFDKQHRPLGLQIQDGERVKKLSQVDGGVFFIKNGIPEIVHTRDYVYEKNISTALQCRPRLVHKGRIIDGLKHQIAKRTFIGITRDKQIIIGVTENSEAYAKDLATVLALDTDAGGLACEYALNLDGGSSSQLFMEYKDYTKDISGSIAVPNAITVSLVKPSPGYSCTDQ